MDPGRRRKKRGAEAGGERRSGAGARAPRERTRAERRALPAVPADAGRWKRSKEQAPAAAGPRAREKKQEVMPVCATWESLS